MGLILIRGLFFFRSVSIIDQLTNITGENILSRLGFELKFLVISVIFPLRKVLRSQEYRLRCNLNRIKYFLLTIKKSNNCVL